MEIRRYLPSTRFAVFVLSIVVAIVLVIAASYLGAGKPISSALAVISNVTTGQREIGDIDTDGDGLRDWEEGVRGTDPKRADSDNDGTNDGDEVKANRDPNKPGPDDSLADEASEKFLAELLASASSTNLTDNLSQTIFARYVAARGKGSSGDIQTQSAVVREAVANAETSYRGTIYMPATFTVVAKNPTTVRAFANGSMQAMLNHPSANFMLAMQIFGEGMEGSKTAASRLRAIGAEYRAIAREMATVPVPAEYLNQYVLAVNALEVAGGAFEDMAYIGEDPILAVAGLQNYDRMISGGAGIFVKLAQEIARTGLVFSAKEPGRVWNDFVAIAKPS